jgi:hypothetical protein
LVLIADSARRYRQADDPQIQALAGKILAAFVAEKARLLTWLAGPLAESAVFIATCVPAVREAVLLGLESSLEPPFFAFLGLAELDAPPAWAIESSLPTSVEVEAHELRARTGIAFATRAMACSGSNRRGGQRVTTVRC